LHFPVDTGCKGQEVPIKRCIGNCSGRGAQYYSIGLPVQGKVMSANVLPSIPPHFCESFIKNKKYIV
jgi:hypothetical protein